MMPVVHRLRLSRQRLAMTLSVATLSVVTAAPAHASPIASAASLSHHCGAQSRRQNHRHNRHTDTSLHSILPPGPSDGPLCVLA